MKKHKKHKGLLSVELVVAISVLATIIGVLVALAMSFGKLNNHLWIRHVCYNAAQAQADAIAVSGKAIDNAVFKRLWPGVDCTIEITDGTGQWQGLRKVDLMLSKKAKSKTVCIQVTRYLPPAQGGDQ